MEDYKLRKLVIKPTMACTANCPTCKLRRNLHKSLTASKKLSFEQWLTIFEDAAKLGVERLDISGGEPTLYKKLIDLIEAGKQYGWYVNLNSNGSMINENYAERLVTSGLDSISISIYSADPRIHDRMRNSDGLWEKATRAVKTFSMLKKRHPSFQIATQCLICRENYRTLADLMKLDYELGSDRVALTYLEGDFEKKYLLDENEIHYFRQAVVPEIKAFCETLDPTIREDAIRVVESLYSKQINSASNFAKGLYRPRESNLPPCQRPKNFTILLANGDVHPCNMVEYSHEPVMGNLFEKSLLEIWHSDKWNQFRKSLFDYCQWCPINLYMTIPLKPKEERRFVPSSPHNQEARRPFDSTIICNENNNGAKLISPSLWMYQSVKKMLGQQTLMEWGYPDLEESQYWSHEKMSAFQNARLRKLLDYAYTNIKGYRHKFDEAGVKPSDIKSTNDLYKLPLTTRQELQNNEDFVNRKLVHGTLHTGGSTGTSLKYHESEISGLIRLNAHLRGWKWGGFEPDMRYCILKSAQREERQGNCIHLIGDLTDDNLKKNLEIVQAFRPVHLKGYVGALYIFAKYCLDNDIQLEGITSVIPSSENLYDYQRQIMERAFDCKVFEEYCCNDGGACAWECEKRDGLHHVIERAVMEDVEGKMIVTDLWNYAMPFIRYENGDSVEFLNKKCSCGRSLPLIKVKGRANDIIITPKGAINPSFLLHHGIGLVGVDKKIPHFRSGIRAIQYVQKPGNILEVNIVRNNGCTNADIENLKKDLNEFIGGLQIRINLVDRIPKTKKGKRAFIINEDKELLCQYLNGKSREHAVTGVKEAANKDIASKPKVSVLLAVYNCEKFIDQALKSIYDQTYQDFEVVIVDDGSTDKTSEILRDMKDSRTFIHTNSENKGLTASLNIGFNFCVGEYIARMDADDISLPQRFEKQVRHLDENPTCAAVGSWCIRIDSNNKIISNWRHPTEFEDIKERLLEENSIFHGTAMVRRQSLMEIGGYDEKYRYSQDYDLWMRLSETAKIQNLGEFLYLLRSSPESVSSTKKEQQDMYAERVCQEALQRTGTSKPTMTSITSLSENVDEKHFRDPASDYFLKAWEELNRENFEKAVEYMQKYTAAMDYSKLPRILNEKSKCHDIDVSVIIVTYNRTEHLKRNLEFLSKQDDTHFEVIIVDNGASGFDICRQHADQYVKCPINFILSEGRNIGAFFARGRIIALLDDDAVASSNYISSIKSAFDQFEIFGLRGRTYPLSGSHIDSHTNIYDLGDKPFPSYCNQEGNSAWLRHVYISMGGMDPLLFGHEGSDLTYRIINEYKEPNKIIYWPSTIIYHDYTNEQKFRQKIAIHQRSAQYLKYKHKMDIFINRRDIEGYPIPPKQDQLQQSATPVTCQGMPSWLVQNVEYQAKHVASPEPNSSDITSAASISHSQPTTSIVISCYNCERFLPKCVDSIRNQTMESWELFLLDDASTDGTRNIIEQYSRSDQRIKAYYFSSNSGPYVRRNFAIEKANCDFIVIQDSDDIMHPKKLEVLYNEITKDRLLGVVGSFYLLCLDEFKGLKYTDKIELPLTHEGIINHYNSKWYVCWHGSAIIRKSMFETIGLYDEHPYGSDKFWLAKAAEYARFTSDIRFKNIPEYLTCKVEHPSSQQGLLPVLDTRSRRAKFQTYWLCKLMKIREKAIKDPSVDIKTELRNCKCNDYIRRYEPVFQQWESEPIDDMTLCRFIRRAVTRFNEAKYVSCIILLDSIERIAKNSTKRFRNYDLLRAMAYFGIDRKEKCLGYLNQEIENHNNGAAKKFIRDYLENQLEANVDIRHVASSKFNNLCIIDTDKENYLKPRGYNVPEQHISAAQNKQEVDGRDCPKSCEDARPLVSVIIPAYNAAEHIQKAIESVLIQNYRNFELLIINDGSTDNTEEIIRTYKSDKIKYIRQENCGLAATHNAGIRQSGGEFVVKLDADDMMAPDFISKHLQEFENHPDADLVYCDDYLIDKKGKPLRVIDNPEYADRKSLIRDLFRSGFPIVPFRTCIRRSVFDKIGFFDESLHVGEDYDMMRRFVQHGLKVHHLRGALYLRRMGFDSLSRDFTSQKASSLFEILRRFVDTFNYDELFPDVAWETMAPERRPLYAKGLVAATYLAMGQAHAKANSPPVYINMAFGQARSELNDCLKIDPNNRQIRQLVQQCELDRQEYAEQVQQAVC